MARLLVATVPLTGHVQPMRLVVRELVARGHSVRWYGARKFAAAIEATGAQFAAMEAARDWDDAEVEAAFPALRGRRGLARVKTQLREMFIAPMVDQLRDLERLVAAETPDAIVADSAHLGAALVAETSGVPWAGLGISAIAVPSRDTAPFGSAQRPERGGRFLNWLVFRVMFGDINRAFRRARVAAGLPAGRGMYFEVMSPQLFLQPTVPAFEYPRRDLPPQLHFIGPLVPRDPPATATLPPWWPAVAAATAAGVPIVVVTQGTLATDVRELIEPAVRGLADEPVLVIATAPALPGVPPPANTRLAAFVPFQAVLPHAAVMVTNGGYGGVQMALGHGVPLVVAGGSEEKPEIAARVRWSGVGVDLRTGRPTPAQVRAAVQRVLAEPRFRARAGAIAADMARHDAPVEAAELIEALIRRRAPIVRVLSAG